MQKERDPQAMEAFRAKNAKAQAGFSVTTAKRLVAEGQLVKLRAGVYRGIDAPDADLRMIEAATRHPEQATICLGSALAWHGLIDDAPDELHVALPRGSRVPRNSGGIRWHTFDRRSLQSSQQRVLIPNTGIEICVTEPAASLIDVLRTHGAEGHDQVVAVIGRWMKETGGTETDLRRISREFPRSRQPLERALREFRRLGSGAWGSN